MAVYWLGFYAILPRLTGDLAVVIAFGITLAVSMTTAAIFMTGKE